MIEIVRNNFSVDPNYMPSGLDARAENGHSQFSKKHFLGSGDPKIESFQRK